MWKKVRPGHWESSQLNTLKRLKNIFQTSSLNAPLKGSSFALLKRAANVQVRRDKSLLCLTSCVKLEKEDRRFSMGKELWQKQHISEIQGAQYLIFNGITAVLPLKRFDELKKVSIVSVHTNPTRMHWVMGIGDVGSTVIFRKHQGGGGV